MAPLTVEDLSLIKALWIEKSWAVNRMIAELKARERCTLYYFVRRIDSTRSVERLPDSGRRRSVRTDSNIELVSDLILSQGWQPGTRVRFHGRSHERLEFHILQLWELARMICSSVFRRREVQSLTTCRQTEMIDASVWRNVWLQQDKSYLFLGFKDFLPQTPFNSQNDRVYANVKAKRDVSPSRLLCFHIVHLPAE